ncbi:cupin domain-containing protein [Mycolicibacterium stellerae]|uniref:cupin domain-containing protein n=1 Tax=Mycolicibacterium stellerae TaxID=2358193 RepID=UPI000F0B0957|nr:cupin domain-containing protein [Mycolicibacterium stellerae]
MPQNVMTGKATAIPAQVMFDGRVARSAIQTDNAMVVFNYLDDMTEDIPPHDHPFDQLALIFGGAMEFIVDGEKYIVEDGGYLYIPAGLPHTGKALGSGRVLNIDVFSPARADFAHLVEWQGDNT